MPPKAKAYPHSQQQSMEALRKANKFRIKRANLKKDLKSGAVAINDILLDPPDYVLTAKVFNILQSVPKFGVVKAARVLTMSRVSQSKTIGGLTDRQRDEIINSISRMARRPDVRSKRQ